MIKTIAIPFKSTIYHSTPAALTPTTPLLVFIPGNPGFIEYYTEYLSSFTEQFEILGIAHAGFCSEPNIKENQRIYSLSEQVQHKVDILKQYTGENREVHVIGHSVGCWVAQRVVDLTCDDINYKFIGLITPTVIDIHTSTKGSVLHPVVRTFSWFYKIVGGLSRIIGLLPNAVTSALVDQAIMTDFQGAKDITKHFISNHKYVEQSLGLATEEMLTIQSDWEYQRNFFTKHKDTYTWIFFTSPDHWVHDSTQNDIEESLKNNDNVLFIRDDAIRHSFCINQSNLLADITRKAISHYS